MQYRILIDEAHHTPTLTQQNNSKQNQYYLTTKTYETKAEAQKDVDKFLLFQKTNNHYLLADVPNVNMLAIHILLGKQ